MSGTPSKVAILLSLLPLWACNNPPAQPKKAAVSQQVVGPATNGPINYDVRRIRPRNEETLEDAFAKLHKQALADKKRVAVLFSADWCEPCRILDAELGDSYPAEQIGDVRIFEFKEEDWSAVTRLDEYNKLRKRWDSDTGAYPMLALVRSDGSILEEMKKAKERLEAAGQQATLPNWFVDTRELDSPPDCFGDE